MVGERGGGVWGIYNCQVVARAALRHVQEEHHHRMQSRGLRAKTLEWFVLSIIKGGQGALELFRQSRLFALTGEPPAPSSAVLSHARHGHLQPAPAAAQTTFAQGQEGLAQER